MKSYYLYILTNKFNRVLYVGITNDIHRRLYEHKQKLIEGFTKKYNLYKLVYIEQFSDIRLAISSEKKVKGWTRKKKILLIETLNPQWKELTL